MQIFTTYVQPLTTWFYDHPNLALIITFLVSFAESLAIIGSLVPGSVTMTAIGILAGSGVMRVDFTFIAAVLGAVAGDGASYMLGYTFSDRLPNIWPFSRYPNWLGYGKEYFKRHGGKSVLIGRFVGPLRSLIPVIAGMMRMRRWHFFLANVASAIGWSILFILPGVIIGAASTELPTESATHLILGILLILAIIGFAGHGMRWLFLRVQHFLRIYLHAFWKWGKHHQGVATVFKNLTPRYEKNHFPTAALLLSCILLCAISIVFIYCADQGVGIVMLNNPIHLALQSLRTKSFDVFFILITLLFAPISTVSLILSISGYAIYFHNWRLLRYWLSLCLASISVLGMIGLMIVQPSASDFIKNNTPPTFPDINLTIITALLSFLVCYANTHLRRSTVRLMRIVTIIFLFFAGLSLMYLGDSLISSVFIAYFIGLSIGLAHWFFYRRLNKFNRSSPFFMLLVFLLLLMSASISYVLYFKSLMQEHTFQPKQYALTHQAWWRQQRPLLPIYTTNRLGQRTGLFNIQYVGSLSHLQQALETYGWKEQPDIFFYSLLMRATGQHSIKELPILSQLYLNEKPVLTMTYQAGNNQNLFILRFWRSNYHLQDDFQQTIWLGSIIHPRSKNTRQGAPIPIFSYLLPALDHFKVNCINFSSEQIKSLPANTSPSILMIKGR